MYSCYCYPSQKEKLKIDDALDVSSVHGVTGILGTLAVGLIASSLINPAGPNGLIYGNHFQIGLQTLGL
jgi:ammonium transporter, Amt family